jgi:type IV secretory pathway VirB6-like protein
MIWIIPTLFVAVFAVVALMLVRRPFEVGVSQRGLDRKPGPSNGGRQGGFHILSGVVCVCVVVFSIGFSPDANATLSDTMRGIFSNNLNSYVVGIMADPANPINNWSSMMFITLSVLLVLREVMIFIFDGVNAASHLEAIIYFFATLAIWQFYGSFTDAIWGVGVGISDGFQEYLVGNTDSFFLSQWINKSMMAVSLEEVDMFDAVRLIAYSLGWSVVSGILDLLAWVASVWAFMGYALAKVLGLFFVPFLLLPSTRGLFDKWVQFFVGFVFLLIMLKATLVITAMVVQSALGELGLTWTVDYGDPVAVITIAKERFFILMDTTIMMILGILLIISSFVFAGMLSSGVGSTSGALGSMAKKAIRKVI